MSKEIALKKELILKVKIELKKVLSEKVFSWDSLSKKDKAFKFLIWYENLANYPSEVVIKSLRAYMLDVSKKNHDIAVFFRDYLEPNFNSHKHSLKNEKTMMLLEKPLATDKEIEDWGKEISEIFKEKSV